MTREDAVLDDYFGMLIRADWTVEKWEAEGALIPQTTIEVLLLAFDAMAREAMCVAESRAERREESLALAHALREHRQRLRALSPLRC